MLRLGKEVEGSAQGEGRQSLQIPIRALVFFPTFFSFFFFGGGGLWLTLLSLGDLLRSSEARIDLPQLGGEGSPFSHLSSTC